MEIVDQLKVIDEYIDDIKKANNLSEREKALIRYIDYQRSQIANKDELIGMLNGVIDECKALEEILQNDE